MNKLKLFRKQTWIWNVLRIGLLLFYALFTFMECILHIIYNISFELGVQNKTVNNQKGNWKGNPSEPFVLIWLWDFLKRNWIISCDKMCITFILFADNFNKQIIVSITQNSYVSMEKFIIIRNTNILTWETCFGFSETLALFLVYVGQCRLYILFWFINF